MSLARLALRLAAYEALNPYATVAAGPWPTIAGNLVYDSRVDLLQEDDRLAEIEGKPLLIVYTEQDTSTPYGTAKYPPDEQIVHLVIEAMIAAKGVVDIDNGDGTKDSYGTLTAPITDRQHEALLDLLEGMVRRSLDTRNRTSSAGVFGLVAMETHRIESVPQRADDRITRMAARTITFTIKVRKEVWATLPGTALSGLDVLPEPLRSVAKALDPASTGGLLCQSLVAQMQALQPDPLVPLGSIAILTPEGDPAGVDYAPGFGNDIHSTVPLQP